MYFLEKFLSGFACAQGRERYKDEEKGYAARYRHMEQFTTTKFQYKKESGIHLDVLKINSKGSALEYCGYVGGESLDYGEGIAVETLHNVYIGGRTMSPDFPIIAGPDFLYNGEMDGFVAKISEVSVKTTKPRVKKHN